MRARLRRPRLPGHPWRPATEGWGQCSGIEVVTEHRSEAEHSDPDYVAVFPRTLQFQHGQRPVAWDLLGRFGNLEEPAEVRNLPAAPHEKTAKRSLAYLASGGHTHVGRLGQRHLPADPLDRLVEADLGGAPSPYLLELRSIGGVPELGSRVAGKLHAVSLDVEHSGGCRQGQQGDPCGCEPP